MHFDAGFKAVEHAQGHHKHILEVGNSIYTHFYIVNSAPENKIRFCSLCIILF
jgi:hypothetical protein